MKRLIKASKDISLAFICPRCTNRSLYDLDNAHLTAPWQVGYRDRFLCDECAMEFFAFPQSNGSVRFEEVAMDDSEMTQDEYDEIYGSIDHSKYRHWTDVYREFQNILDEHLQGSTGSPDELEEAFDAIDDFYLRGVGHKAFDEAYRRWTDYEEGAADKLVEKRKQKEPEEVRYIIKDRHGNQISAPSTDDDELWRRVERMENRGVRGLSVVAYVESCDSVTSSEDSDVEVEEDDEVTEMEQEFTSEKTSINSNKLPAIFRLAHLSPGTLNLDYGGGKFDNATEYLAEQGITNLIYDPYNRTREHNQSVLREIRKNGGADTATCSNVLNVIKEPDVRLNVLRNIQKLVKPGGQVYFTVHEGSKDGKEGPTKSGYQLNRRTGDYLEEIQQIFPDAKKRGKLIYATNVK